MSTRTKLEMISRLKELGFSFDEAMKLRRIQMTLHNWSEMECGSDRGCIERDEATGKPFRVYTTQTGSDGRYPTPDREFGALKRLKAIMSAHPELISYHQTDPRGCALFILRKADVNASNIEQVYNRGVAVCD